MGEEKEKYNWKKLIRSQKKAFSAFIVAGSVAFIGFFLVFLWLVESSLIGGQGDWNIGLWSMKHLVDFLFLSIFWELVLVVAPAAVFFGVFGYMWWTNLSEEIKAEFKSLDAESKRKRRNKPAYQGGGGGFGTFILLCIMIALDGKWATPFASLPYSYFIYQMLLGIMWIAIIIGIPVMIAVLIWYFTKKKKE